MGFIQLLRCSGRRCRADMEKAKDLFYDIFGWDRTTGVPTRETLEKYDLADMADDLEKRGIYAQNTAAAE